MSKFFNHRNGPIGALLLSLCCYLAGGAWTASAQSSSPPQDVVRRYEGGRLLVIQKYSYALLDAALERSVARYGRYKVEPVATEMSPARLRKEVLKGDLINVVVRPPGNKEMDEGLIPVDVPLEKGLFGYRVPFIRAGDQTRLEHVRNIAGLQQLRLGTAEEYLAKAIYQHNGIEVVTAGNYGSLLLMLEHGRLDVFPVGINWFLAEAEYNHYKNKYPTLAIEQHLLIHYPFAHYVYVSKSALGLSERIRYGLQEMQNDGSFDRLFDKHFAQAVVDLRFHQRTIIELENPFLPAWAKIPKIKWR